MAIKVIVTSLSNYPAGGKNDGWVNLQLISDYESPMAYGASLQFQIKQAASKHEAIDQALAQLSELADEIKQGVVKAKEDHPVGG